MDFSTPDQLQDGTRVFIDSSIFIYHFLAASEQCRHLLARCEQGQLKGVTSVVVLAEVAHRLMMIEARAKKLVTPGNLAQKLRANPELVKQLEVYQQQVDLIPLMGVDILSLEIKWWLRSADLRHKYGLMTNDSLIGATALGAGISALASGDRDFAGLEGLKLYLPNDVSL